MLKHDVAYQGDYVIVHKDDYKMLHTRSIEVDLEDKVAEITESNKRSPERVHEQALELIEDDTEMFNKLKHIARTCIANERHFNLQKLTFFIELTEQQAAKGDDALKKEIAKRYARWHDTSILANVIRELICRIPELGYFASIRKCKASKFYPQLQCYEAGRQPEHIKESQLRNNAFADYDEEEIRELLDEMGPEWNG
ncbi:hypothetical protein [Paratractidigestivibacter sp.]|uniref:hypothetical protein n=1 Tax=Paratractidigestivibacter sp. TaxID=2847316 RepID=UPI002ABD5FC7|nr:hypothetical protein [Paratractidigestivibacter sp.]